MRKQPSRTCVACRRSDGKKGFLRLVKKPDGSVEMDSTGKQPGRGAYICPMEECLALALKKRNIERALRTQVSERVIDQLRAIIEKKKDGQSAQAVGNDGSK